VRALAGRHDDADRHFRRGIDSIRDTEYTVLLPRYLAASAELQLVRGRASEANALLDEAEAINLRTGYDVAGGQLRRVRQTVAARVPG